MNKKPEGMTEEHFTYLDELRESGETNMFGAGAYVERRFCVSSATANKFVSHWMETFGERHP